jgi:hypothetical protein
MKKIIKRAYKRIPQDKANSFANVVYQRMKDDPKFESLMPVVTELKIRNTAFEVANANAADGGKKFTIIKNECFDAMIAQLDDVADAVEFFAKGDEKVALDAGFELIAVAKSINNIAMPIVVKAENDPDHTGVALFKLIVDKYAVNTGIEYQKAGDTTWQNGTFTTSSVASITVSEAGVAYYFRFYSNGRKGLQSDKTEPVSVLVS